MTMTSDVSPAVSGGEPAARVLRRRLLSDESIDALLADLDAGGLSLTGQGGFLPELLKAVLERGMQVELADHLGYEKGDPAGRGGSNPRNGSTPNTVATQVGDVRLDTPRDRAGSFTPALVPKGARRLGGLDEMIISLYAGGMTVRDIEHHLARTLGTEISRDTISKITDAVLEEVKAWQNRPLDPVYPVVLLDALIVKVRAGNVVSNKAAHIAVGVDTDGVKHVLGIWVQSAEGATFWAQVCAELANRGVKDILIACCDGLAGLPEAIEATWPATVVQTCVVHLIRAATRYVSYADRKAFCAALKTVYTAANADAAQLALLELAESPLGRKYPAAVAVWERAWDRFIPFLAFPPAVRKVIYTTNSIESLNYQLRKIIKNRGHFCSASEFVNQFPVEIPSHGSACPTDLEAGHDVCFTRVWTEATPATVAEREVRVVDVDRDRAGDAAGGGRAVRGGPLDRDHRVSSREAGRVGRVGGVGAGPAGAVRARRRAGRGERRGGAAAGDGGRAGRGVAFALGKSALGLNAGPVPARVDESVKAGLLDLLEHAVDRGWSARRAARLLGLDHARAGRWQARREAGQLIDRSPGGHPLHGILDHERAAILDLFETWGQIDRSHRKLAHRGSRLGLVHVSESTVRRVLAAEGLVLPGQPAREPTPRTPWPDWLEWKPNRIWAYDFTHFTRAHRVALAIIDLVSRKWITTLVSAEESSIQVEVAFTAALRAEDPLEAADAHATTALREALICGDRNTVATLTGDGQLPLLLAISDNGPQMRSVSTREFLAGVAIAQQFGRPHTPQAQAWIETLFGHVKGEWPQLEKIRDPAALELEIDQRQVEYNTVRLHAGVGYVTPDDEHTGRGDGIRQARRDGLTAARDARINYRRTTTEDQQ